METLSIGLKSVFVTERFSAYGMADFYWQKAAPIFLNRSFFKLTIARD